MNNVEEDVQSVVDAYLSLGSNMGDRLGHLKAATHALAQSENIEVIKVSSVYETDPWGYEDQRPFYNAVIRIRTTLSPMELLRLCQTIEHQQHRVRQVRWGPRTLDIDILMYGDRAVNSLELTIPHPRMEERDFVLVPLAEITSGRLAGDRPGVRKVLDNWYPMPGSQAFDL